MEKPKAFISNAQLFETFTDIAFTVDGAHRIGTANRAAGEFCRLSAGQLAGTMCFVSFGSNGQPCPQCPVTQALQSGQVCAAEFVVNGQYWLVRGFPVCDEQGALIGALEIRQDISVQKRSELLRQEALLKNEQMVREMHHRIKNNLQLITSLVNLQSRGFRDASVSAAFTETSARIRTIALIHEQLCASKTAASFDLGIYINSLLEYLSALYPAEAQRIRRDVSIEVSHTDIDCAQMCGLIINELVANAYKYAFPQLRRGNVTVRLRDVDTDQIELSVGDDGVGLPENVNYQEPSSFGLRLVNMLADQLRAETTVISGAGTKFIFQFKRSKER